MFPRNVRKCKKWEGLSSSVKNSWKNAVLERRNSPPVPDCFKYEKEYKNSCCAVFAQSTDISCGRVAYHLASILEDNELACAVVAHFWKTKEGTLRDLNLIPAEIIRNGYYGRVAPGLDDWENFRYRDGEAFLKTQPNSNLLSNRVAEWQACTRNFYGWNDFGWYDFDDWYDSRSWCNHYGW